MSDVARLAGVNRVTASTVLNNSPASTRVSEGTRRRVLDAAARLRYQPNAIARSLRERTTHTICFYSGDSYSEASNPFISQTISGLQHGCEQHRKGLLIRRHYTGESPREVYGELASGKLDGVIYYGWPDDPVVELLSDSHVPVVAIADHVPVFPSVLVDDHAGGRLQAEYLAGLGHRRIFYQSMNSDVASVRARSEAFAAAAAELGLEVREDRSARGATGLSDAGVAFLQSRSGDRPTALVGWADLCAYGMIGRCLQLGLNVPGEVAVMGFDDIALPVEPLWRMTTIRARWREVAITAVSLLLDQIEGKEVPLKTVVPIELVVGNTT